MKFYAIFIFLMISLSIMISNPQAMGQVAEVVVGNQQKLTETEQMAMEILSNISPSNPSSVNQEIFVTLRELLEAGTIGPNVKNSNNQSFFQVALFHENWDLVKTIIEHPDFEVDKFLTSDLLKELPSLAQKNFFEKQKNKHFEEIIIKIMSSNKFNPNLVIDKNGKTLGMFFSSIGNAKFLKLLDEKGADFQIQDKKGLTAYDYAIDKNFASKMLKLLNPKLFQMKLEENFSQLIKVAGLPPQAIQCELSDVMSHIDTLETEKEGSCSICQNKLAQGQAFWRNGSCPCLYCKDCAISFKNQLIHHNLGKVAECPVHKDDGTSIPFSFLAATYAKKEELEKYKLLVVENKLSTVDGFRFCLTPNCLNGKVLSKGAEEWWTCDSCGGESYLTYSKIGEMPLPTEMVRPCPHCYTLFAKDNQCNHVDCKNPNCGKKWHFRSGKEDPKGEFDNYDKRFRTYRVPGDKKKNGELYTEYVENVDLDDNINLKLHESADSLFQAHEVNDPPGDSGDEDSGSEDREREEESEED